MKNEWISINIQIEFYIEKSSDFVVLKSSNFTTAPLYVTYNNTQWHHFRCHRANFYQTVHSWNSEILQWRISLKLFTRKRSRTTVFWRKHQNRSSHYISQICAAFWFKVINWARHILQQIFTSARLFSTNLRSQLSVCNRFKSSFQVYKIIKIK